MEWVAYGHVANRPIAVVENDIKAAHRDRSLRHMTRLEACERPRRSTRTSGVMTPNQRALGAVGAIAAGWALMVIAYDKAHEP